MKLSEIKSISKFYIFLRALSILMPLIVLENTVEQPLELQYYPNLLKSIKQSNTEMMIFIDGISLNNKRFG